MPSTTPFSNPRNSPWPHLGETPIQGRRVSALPRQVREKQHRGQSLTRGSSPLVLNPFRYLVASPATPNTPTPIPSPGPGFDSVSFGPSSLRGSTTPERSFSPTSNSSLSPPDSPYPSTPISPALYPDPSATGNQSDADLFETSTRADEIEGTLGVVVSPILLERDSKRGYPQGSPSPINGAGGTVRPGQVGSGVLAAVGPANRLERPFTRGISICFHDPPRQYTLAQKADVPTSNDTAPHAAFVLRSSPKIIEEDGSDEELEPETRDDDDITAYPSPCEDPKINELVSKVASLGLGTSLSIARPIITPARVHTHVPALVPTRTPVSPPMAFFHTAVIHTAVTHPSTAEHATPMEVDEDVPCLEVLNKGAPRPQEILEVVPMVDVVFYPELKDVQMSEAFATNLDVTSFGSLTRGPPSAGSAFYRSPAVVIGTTWDPKFIPHQAQRTPSTPLQPFCVPERTIFDVLCQSSKPAVFPGSTTSLTGPHSRLVNSWAH